MPDRSYTNEQLEDAVRACLMDIVPDVDLYVVRASDTPQRRRYVRVGIAAQDPATSVLVYLPDRPVAASDVPRITRLAYNTLLDLRAARPGEVVELEYLG